MEIFSVVVFSIIVLIICVIVIKISFVEAEAEKHAITLFFLRKDMENPQMLLKQLTSTYCGKVIIVNVDGLEDVCSACKILCEDSSYLTYCELQNMNETIKNEYFNRFVT